MNKDPSEKELDKMIDQSVDSMKKEEKKPAKEKEGKNELLSKGADDKKSTNAPKYVAPAIKGTEGFDPWQILNYPHLAEKSMNMVEMENKLIFIVRRTANKAMIKEAIEKGFNVKVLSVNVTITRKGNKKAYIKLAPGSDAADIATRLGMI